jgi:tetratricopeptide (TPR) repeat protein
MKPSAPARSGLLPVRLASQLSTALGALILAGCASMGAEPGSGLADGGNEAASAAATARARAADGMAPGTEAVLRQPGGSTQAHPPARTVARGEPASAPGDTGQDGAEPHAASPDGSLPEVALSSELLFQLLASEVAAQRGEVASAASTYLSMARQTRDPRLAQRATELALAARMAEGALSAARLWHELSPASSRAAQTLETLLLSTGQLTEAEPLLRARLVQARADGQLSSAYQQIQRVLVRAANPAEALAMLDRLAAPDADVAAARMALAAQASAAGDAERAASEAAAALKLDPEDESIAVSTAEYLAQSPAGNDAGIALLQRFLKRQPKALDARFALARMLAADKREDAAREQFEQALAQQPDSPAVLFSLAQLAWQTRQPKVAEQYLKRYLALPDSVQRNDNPAWLFLGQIAEDERRTEDAISYYANVRRGEQALPALVRRAVLLSGQGRLEEARKLLHEGAATNNRDRVQLISAEAQLLREAGRASEALALLRNALDRLPENPDLLYDYAMMAERVDRLDIMESSLRKLIALRPDHAHAYNALGYTFADRNIRLDEAEELIGKALALRPGDPHIIDSMGWVRYRRGDLEGAIELLRKAWALSPEIDIAAHLGEVLWKAGQAEEARRLWREARKREPDNATLRETLARLNVSL